MIKTYKPTTPSRRFKRTPKDKRLSDKRPEKALTKPLKKKAGRSRGKISVRGRGGGHKRLYRTIDFKRRDKEGVEAEVIALEYDPNRSAHLALLEYADGEKRYILAPQNLSIGDLVVCGSKARIRTGNALPLGLIPVGTEVHNLELKPGQGAKLVRSAGQSARIMAKEGDWVNVKLPSGEIRKFRFDCYATIGQLGNLHHARRVLGKAGATRHRGRRPKVRGTAMPAGEHPHGGGEGRTGPGGPAKTPWGKIAHGKKTRKKNKPSDKYIVKSRHED